MANDGSGPDELFFEAIDLGDMLVILPDGSSLPIVSMWNEDGDVVDDFNEAETLLVGNQEIGYYEIDFTTVGDPVTLH